MSRIPLKVRHEAEAKGVLDVKALGGNEIASDFGSAFAEADAPVVEGDRLGVQTVVWIESWGKSGGRENEVYS